MGGLERVQVLPLQSSAMMFNRSRATMQFGVVPCNTTATSRTPTFETLLVRSVLQL